MEERIWAVIGEWTQSDGTEDWDVLHKGPLTMDEAKNIAKEAGNMWRESTKGTPNENMTHTERIITKSELDSRVEEYNGLLNIN